MLAVSQNYKDAIESETRNIKARITMKGVTYTNSDIFNVEYNSGSITGETFNIGSTFSNSIKVTFSSIIEELLLDDQVKLEFGVVLSDSTIEYVKMGTFFITSYDPQRNDFKTVIEASDKMIQLNGVYKSKLIYPARIKDIALEIANFSGASINQTTFSRLSESLVSTQPVGYTFRQAIGLIAQFECGFALFDRNGLLDIRMLSDPEYVVNPSGYFSKGLTKNETNYTISGINCKVVQKKGESSETIVLQSGSASGAQISLENNVMTQALLDAIYQRLRNINYFPFSLAWRGNPAIEAGDWITVVDIKGNRFKVPNLNYKLSFSGGIKAVSSANTQTVSASSYQYKGNLQQQIYELSGRIGAAGNHVYDGLEEPVKPKEKDLWFKPNGPDTEIWIYQNGEWVFQVSTAKNPEIAEAIEQAQTEVTEAKTAAQDAVDKANASVAAVQANTQLITDVNVIANNAKTQAQTAATNAQTALTNAQTALDKANGVSSKVTTIETNIDTINGTLSSKADTIDLNALKGRVTTAESSITQNANDIKLKANQTDVNTIGGKVSSLESSLTVQSGQITALNTKTDGQTTQIGSLLSSYNGLTSTISSVKSDLDNMVIGGTNILATTTEDKTFQGNGTENQWGILSLLTKSKLADYGLKVGDKVTFSATCEISGSGFSGILAPRLRTAWTNLTSNYGTYTITKAEKIYFKSTFTMTEARLSNGTGIDFRADNVPSTVSMKWSNLKLEIGDKVTYYSPAPEEKANQIQVTQIAQDLDGFKTTVSNTYLSKSDASGTYADKNSVASQINQSATAITSNVQTWTNDKLTSYSTTQQTTDSITNAVANKADKSQITQLSNQITSTVTGSTNETLISTQMISSTTLKHPNFPNMPMVEVPVVNGESYTVSSNHPWENNAAHVFYIRVTTTQPLTATNGIYDGKSITLPAMSDKIYIVFRTQTIADRFISGQYWVKVTKTPASQSQITQLANDINLRVSKGDVTSQINIEAGRTLIDTKQLLLNANTVKFSGSAFIPNAMIQNLSAEKITAGTLNAANVNVINLNAANITTGTLSGANLSMNLNTGAVQFTKGYIEGGNGRIRLDLDNSYLKSFNTYNNNGFEIQDGVLKLYSSALNSSSVAAIETDILARDGGVNISAIGGVSLLSTKYKASIGVGTGGLANGNEISLQGNAYFWNDLMVLGKKNAIHVTRDGVRGTPAYETAESYLGDIGGNYTRENCEVWVDIEKLFSDTVNTDIAYHIFLQAYDDAHFWVEDFKPDKFLIKSDKPMARFAWEIKAKRRGYENDRLVIQEGVDNKILLEAYSKGVFKGDSEDE